MDGPNQSQFQAVPGVFTKITKRVDLKLKKCKIISHLWTVTKLSVKILFSDGMISGDIDHKRHFGSNLASSEKIAFLLRTDCTNC